MIKNIAVLGSTGSIGKQTLDIISEYPDRFRASVLVANRSAELLVKQALKYSPERVIIADEQYYEQVKTALFDTGIKVSCGADAICEAVEDDGINIVVTAMVGYSGLRPTISAIKTGKVIALANKETLVVAGELITGLLKDSKSVIYPVDSEHGAFYQCLVGERREDIYKLILTASGGPFRTFSLEQLQHVTVDDALRHPNWSMGAKITIDSATMMNKGFEMIEAKWLFGVSHENIEIVVHPQSIVHSMVEFIDGSVKAQLGLPDMHLPIRYALGLPERLATADRRMNISDYALLTFEKPDFRKFPLLEAAYEAAKRGGNVACVMNAANEVAVAAFLNRQIKFNDIARIVTKTMEWSPFIPSPAHEDFIESNAQAREFAASLIK